jgi:two-component system nitrate/nitrite response regulator NarL
MTQLTAGRAKYASLRVAILVRNEVLRHGLETILGRLPNVADVRHWPSQPGHPGAPGSPTILIVTSAESAEVGQMAGTGMKILMLLDEADTRNPAVAGSVRVDGFLNQQDVSVETLADALDRVMAGEMPIPARLGRELLARAGSVPAAGRPRPLPLTAREQETLLLLADGLSNKQIARRLTISDHGAKRLVTSVLLKLGAPNRTTAVVTAIRTGMIDYTGDKSAAASTSPNSGLAR